MHPYFFLPIIYNNIVYMLKRSLLFCSSQTSSPQLILLWEEESECRDT